MTKRNLEETEPSQETKLKRKSKGMTDIHKHEETNKKQKKDRSAKHNNKKAKTVVEKEIRKPATMQSLLNDKLQKAKAHRLEHSSKVHGTTVKNSDSKIDKDKSVPDKSGLINQVKEESRSDRFTDEHKSTNDEITKSVGLSSSKINKKSKANTEMTENEVEKNLSNKRKKRKDDKADEAVAQGSKEDIHFEIEDNSTLKKTAKKQKKKKQKDSDVGHDTRKHTIASEIDNANEDDDPEKAALRKKKREKRKLKKLKKEQKKNENKEKAGTAKLAAVEYLKQWKNERTVWKFQKVRQVWLLQNMYDQALLDDDSFEVLLEYLEGLKGHSRQKTVSDAETMLEKSEKEEAEMQSERAKQIIQLLSDS